MLFSTWAYIALRRGLVVKLETIRKTSNPTAARVWQRITGGGLDFASVDPLSANHVFGIADERLFASEFPDWKVAELARKSYGHLFCFRAYAPVERTTYADGQVQFERCEVVREFLVAGMAEFGADDDDDD